MNADIIKIKNFVKYWSGHGYEKGEAQPFWLAFIRDIFSINQPEKVIDFETQVKIDGNTKFLDGYLFDSKVLIEQKSSNVKLDDSVFNQAKRYNDALNYTRKARWIITCNFSEFKIYNMETLDAPTKILLEDLPENFHVFDFFIKNRRVLEQDKKLNFDTAIAVGKLYDAMLSSARIKKSDNKPEIFNNLNKLCVRLVFCLYAESAGVFDYKMFRDYLQNENNTRRALLELFKVLNTPLEKRSPYLDDDLKKFPYVDGGLFDDDENFDFPNFSTNAKDILKDLIGYKWLEINPTIFGAVFESTLNQENLQRNIRREEGIHYTAPANIQKVINPLFLDELYKKFRATTSCDDLFNLQNEIAALKFLDPACGSGNFLTETYLLLRELENSILEVLVNNGVKFAENPVKVSIENFYGIEINDFAVAVAKTALWISEIQMRQKTAEIINLPLKHFPLSKIPNIICANALTFDWNNLIAPANLNFIIGNPPFIGHQWRTPEQIKDMQIAFYDLEKHGKLDYVCAWFNKTADFIKSTPIHCAFVSTNSICQGESVKVLWEHIFKKNVHIDFAYKPFKWHNESENMAQVHIVIIGFSQVDGLQKKIFEVFVETDKDGKKVEKISCTDAENINGYLINAPNVFIENRGNPLNANQSKMIKGSQPTDGGNLIIKAEDYEEFIKKEPLAVKYIRQYMGADDFINGKKRYCLWLVDCPPDELRKMKLVYERVKAVKEFRLKSPTKSVREDAETPTLFTQIRQPNTNYLIIPRVSSEKRRYIPIGFMTPNIIASDSIQIITDADNFLFGVLTSSVHMAWLKTVCGRLKSDYRYSPAIYNNFPFCEPTEKQRAKIENTAQKILTVRAGYPNATLADLYDETAMPADLRRAHKENDAAVMAAYEFDLKMTEPEIVSELLKKYFRLTK